MPAGLHDRAYDSGGYAGVALPVCLPPSIKRRRSATRSSAEPLKPPSTNGTNMKNWQHKNLTQLLKKAVNQGL
jgi:hypothetical protein